jgi:hypothetical protein
VTLARPSDRPTWVQGRQDSNLQPRFWRSVDRGRGRETARMRFFGSLRCAELLGSKSTAVGIATFVATDGDNEPVSCSGARGRSGKFATLKRSPEASSSDNSGTAEPSSEWISMTRRSGSSSRLPSEPTEAGPQLADSGSPTSDGKLGLGVTDVYRRELGRTRWTFSANVKHTYAGTTYERERPELVSLDRLGRSVNWTALSLESKTSLKLATLISAGFSPAEAGAVYGISTESVKAALSTLREEIRAQQARVRKRRSAPIARSRGARAWLARLRENRLDRAHPGTRFALAPRLSITSANPCGPAGTNRVVLADKRS